MKNVKPWVPVPGFSKYEVNADRVLRNSKGDNISEKNKTGKYYITKDDGGKKLISINEIMELVGDAVNGCLVGDGTGKAAEQCSPKAKIDTGEKVINAKQSATAKKLLKEIKSGKVKPIKNKKLEKATKKIKKAVAKAVKKKVNKDPKPKAVKKAAAVVTVVAIKKILDAADITSNAIVVKAEKIINAAEPKHAKCYRLMLLGIKNKTISELVDCPPPAVGRNIWFYTSNKYELS